jgi:HORMA domain
MRQVLGRKHRNTSTTCQFTTMSNALPKVWTTLLSATIECWIDQILYRRNVYPPETFRKQSYLGIPCSVCEHPQVRTYIQEALPVIVSSLLHSVTKELQLTIIEVNDINGIHLDPNSVDATVQPSHRVLEKYVLRFQMEANVQHLLEDRYQQQQQQEIMGHPTASWQDLLQELECGMRNLILSTHTLSRSNEATPFSDACSFQLSLHIPEANATCPELNRVMSQGTWYIPSNLDHLPEMSNSRKGAGENTKEIKQPRIIRPIHQYSDARVGSIQFACVQ